MTLSTTTRTIQHLGTGSLATFSYNFRVDEESHLEVFVTDVTGADFEQSDYTVSGTGDPNGGNITFGEDAIPSLNERITISREVPYTQTTDLVEGGLMRAETVESTFDYTVMQTQQLNDETGRTLRAPVSDLSPSMILPPAGTRAEKFMYFDTNGDATVAEGQLIESTHNHDTRYVLKIGSDGTEQTISGSITTTRDITTRDLYVRDVKATGNITENGTQVSLVGHNHDARYYTESEEDVFHDTLDTKIDTTSGTLQTQISILTTDHGGLTGLADDDHTQYHTDARGDARYYTETELDAGQLDNRYYTETELDGGQLNSLYYTETQLDNGQLDTRYYTETEVDSIELGLQNQITTNSGSLVAHQSSDDHDSRYYTETEEDILHGVLDDKIDTTSGTLQADIDGLTVDHGELTGLGDDDHTQYLLHTDFTTYSGSMVVDWTAADAVLDAKIDTTSGTLQDQIDGATIDHGNLTGLGDDDHTQYYNLSRLATWSGTIDHDTIVNTHNLSTDIDHDGLTNTHNLSTDIDHAGLTNTHNLTTDIDHDALTNFAAGEHRVINDAGTGGTELWSASKISGDLGGKSDTAHSHGDLHTQLHSIDSTADHSANNWKTFYSDGSGHVQELTLGTSTYVLTSNGASSAPSWQVGGGGGASDKIEEGNSSVEVVDTGSGQVEFTIDGTERMRLDASYPRLILGDITNYDDNFVTSINIASSGDNRVQFECASNNSVLESNVMFLRYNGTMASKSAVSDNVHMGGLDWWGYDGTEIEHVAALYAEVDGSVSTNTVPTKVVIQTTETNSPTDSLTVHADGSIEAADDVVSGADTVTPDYHYFGDKTTDGSWRMYISGTSFVHERLESGVWNNKQTISA